MNSWNCSILSTLTSQYIDTDASKIAYNTITYKMQSTVSKGQFTGGQKIARVYEQNFTGRGTLQTGTT